MRILFGIIFLGMVVALAACSLIARKSGREFGRAASVLLAGLILPVAGNGIIIVSSARALSLAGCYLYYLGLDISIAALLRFTFEYCRMSWPNRCVRNAVYGVLLIDVLQLLLNPFFHHAFVLTPVQVDGYDYYRMIPYFGQSFHRAVDYLLLAGIITVYVVCLIRTPKLQKEKYSVILGTLIFVTIWETMYIFSGAPIDRSMIGFGVFGLLVFYFSLYYRPMRLLDRMLGSIVSERLQPMYVFDDRQQCLFMNKSGREFLGLEKEETDRVGKALEATFGSRHPGEEEWEDEVVLERNGETRYLSLAKVPQKDQSKKLNGFYIYVRDLTGEHRTMEKKLYNARHDRLTGLFNRDYLFERTMEMLRENPEESFLVIRAEICDLNLVNDLYGNSFGDEALKRTADWIRENTPKSCVSGRLGGESFGLCIPEKDFSQARTERKLAGFLASEEEKRYHPLIHMGIYRVAEPEMECALMFDRARMAMDSIRDDYRISIAWYDESMRSEMLRNRQLSEELDSAIAENQIRAWLQPVVDRKGETIGAEALVRWIHPEEGVRRPDTFIPVFEKNGMIADLDRRIWREACEILARWKKEGRDLFISVNICPRDFFLMDVAEELKGLVREFDLDPDRLRLEITESMMMSDQGNRMEILRELQDAGFRIEMDDFGSGYSSLNLLREMPVDILKIDMVFLSKTAGNTRAQAIVRQVIALARELGITSLIEGVETENQYSDLMDMGCQLYQGYYFSRPVPVEEFERRLEK